MNLPPVLANVVDHLIHPVAVKAFLHAADRWDQSRMKYQAEEYALQVRKLLTSLTPMVEKSIQLHRDQHPQVMAGCRPGR